MPISFSLPTHTHTHTPIIACAFSPLIKPTLFSFSYAIQKKPTEYYHQFRTILGCCCYLFVAQSLHFVRNGAANTKYVSIDSPHAWNPWIILYAGSASSNRWRVIVIEDVFWTWEIRLAGFKRQHLMWRCFVASLSRLWRIVMHLLSTNVYTEWLDGAASYLPHSLYDMAWMPCFQHPIRNACGAFGIQRWESVCDVAVLRNKLPPHVIRSQTGALNVWMTAASMHVRVCVCVCVHVLQTATMSNAFQ